MITVRPITLIIRALRYARRVLFKAYEIWEHYQKCCLIKTPPFDGHTIYHYVYHYLHQVIKYDVPYDCRYAALCQFQDWFSGNKFDIRKHYNYNPYKKEWYDIDGYPSHKDAWFPITPEYVASRIEVIDKAIILLKDERKY